MSDFIKLPNCIYVIGGAGKKLMINSLQKCWFLKEILKPMPTPNKCKIIIIDTALDEKNDDTIQIKKINQKISEITTELLNYSTSEDLQVGKLIIEYRLLTDEMLLKSRVDIIGEKVTNAIRSGTDADIWWLHDTLLGDEWNNKIIKKANLDTINFSKGVYRKRAMGKAIYYKALAEGKFRVEDQGAEIDIICGLGGGTGSGIVVDLAKAIKQILPTSNVHLFGILSTLSESEEEKANCACILDELEYLKLHDSNIFSNIILLPMEPTKYCGNIGLNEMTIPLLKQFDDTFPFVLMSYHNTKTAERIFDLNPSFAPFTLAIPQITRYNIDSIKKLNKELTDSLWFKVDSLLEERKINQHISDFLSKNYKYNPSESNLDINDRTYLYDKYCKLKLLVNLDYFEAMGCARVLLFKKALDAAETSLRVTEEHHLVENILELFSRIKSEIEGNSLDIQNIKLPEKPNLNSKSDSDNCISDDSKHMAVSIEALDRMTSCILFNDVQMLGETASLFMKISQVPEDAVKNVLIGILKQEDENLGRKLNRTRKSKENYEREASAKEMERGSYVMEKDNLKTRLSDSVGSLNKLWLADCYRSIEGLASIDENRISITSNYASLTENLENYVTDVNDLKNKNQVQPSTKLVTESLEKLSKNVGIVGTDFTIHSNTITRVLEQIYKLKINHIICSRQKKLVKAAVDFCIPGRSAFDKEKDEAKSQIELILTKTKEYQYVDLGIDIDSGVITFDYAFNVNAEMELAKNNYIKDVISAAEKCVEQKLGHVKKLEFTLLENDLRDETKLNSLSLEPIVKIYQEYDSKIESIDNSISSLEKDIILVKLYENVYSSLENTIIKIVTAYVQNIAALNKYDTYFNQNPNTDVKVTNSDESYVYVKEIAPTNVYRLLVPNSDINTVISDHKEKARLINKIRESLEKIHNGAYNGLLTNSIESDSSKKRWDYTRISLVVMTKARDIDSAFDVAADIREKFSIDENHSHHQALNQWSLDVADDWSVATVSYIGGVLTDNIYNYVEPRKGYFSTLEGLTKSSRASFFHHSLMLEKGKIINRKRAYNIVYEDKEKFLQDGLDITKELESNFSKLDFRDINNQSSLL